MRTCVETLIPSKMTQAVQHMSKTPDFLPCCSQVATGERCFGELPRFHWPNTATRGRGRQQSAPRQIATQVWSRHQPQRRHHHVFTIRAGKISKKIVV